LPYPSISAHHNGDPVRHELSCRGQPLLGIAIVVGEAEYDILAEDPAGRVELSDRRLDAVLHLLAGEFRLAGQRVREPDEDLGSWIARL
jgi:hypothetical protein